MQRENKILRPRVLKNLQDNDWHTEIVSGTLYNVGFPDLYLIHRQFGTRWLELKIHPVKFQRSQIERFTLWTKYGVGIWVVTNAVQVPSILFKKPNWAMFL